VIESDWPDSDLVFRTAFGEPLYPDTPSQLLPKLIDRYNAVHADAPLSHIRLHDLRHIHATTLLLAGVPVHVVAARLGHADPSVTLRVYAHVIQDLAPAVADSFAQAVEAAAEIESADRVSRTVSTATPSTPGRPHEKASDKEK
jgi:integrase